MNFMLDKDKRNVVRNDKTYHLTTKEYEILECPDERHGSTVRRAARAAHT